jgi:hypothetical protein
VTVYGTEHEDVSQELARYAHDIGERYVVGMKVIPVFAADRPGRRGDQQSYQAEGFAAVRLVTPNENIANQHSATDTIENMSIPYTTRVARVNAAIAASLGRAPKAPIALTSARFGNDEHLKWRHAVSDTNIASYAVMVRGYESASWQQQVNVGVVTDYALKNGNLDPIGTIWPTVFGIKAISPTGGESLTGLFTNEVVLSRDFLSPRRIEAVELDQR